MNAQAGTITITITDQGGALLSCSGCGELRTETDPEKVGARVGALAKAHAGLHATAARQGYSFGYVRHLIDAAGGGLSR